LFVKPKFEERVLKGIELLTGSKRSLITLTSQKMIFQNNKVT
jgi:hypothetical protein